MEHDNRVVVARLSGWPVQTSLAKKMSASGLRRMLLALLETDGKLALPFWSKIPRYANLRVLKTTAPSHI